MNTKQLLVNREMQAHADNNRVNWYSSLHNLREYKSVEKCDFFNTCSSSGDWEGYIVQKIGNKRYLILFSQDNNYPRAGFSIYTGNVSATWVGKLSEDDILSIVSDIVGY